MPFRILKASGRNRYYVVDSNGKRYSRLPLTYTHAMQQLRALWANYG